MSHVDVTRAWKDARYRRSLSEAERRALPENPAGLVELTDEELEMAGGLGRNDGPLTTAPNCTLYTFLGWKACGCGIQTTAPTCTAPSFQGFKGCCP